MWCEKSMHIFFQIEDRCMEVSWVFSNKLIYLADITFSCLLKCVSEKHTHIFQVMQEVKVMIMGLLCGP